MIEKYLKLGIRFRWNKPQNVIGPLDGQVVDSIRPNTALSYIGLGNPVDPQLMVTHVSTMGLQMNMPIQYKWLDYAPGRTSRVPIGPYDVLTGFMSGCIMTHWSDRGVNYIGHVGTIDPKTNPANRVVKRAFAFEMKRGATGFNPAAAWTLGEIQQLGYNKASSVLALVTTRGEFYSVVMFHDQNDWICGGAKRVNPINHDTLKMFMLRDN